jgi:hypothetical protein
LLRLISGSREGFAPLDAFHDELRHLKDRRGEKILALEAHSGELLGSLSLYPDHDQGGHFFRLAAVDILHGDRGNDVEASLLEEAGRYIGERGMTRLKLATSPLLTRNAALYITRFGARYQWREGVRTPEGKPWPYVSCECDFDDPCARPLALREEEVVPRSVLDWSDLQPLPRRDVLYTGPLSVLLPELTPDTLREADRREPDFLPRLYFVFHTLFVHGYEFAWFDRLPQPALPAGGPPFYYVMKSALAV